jgi:UDP-N-acetylmuramoyl-tripeptide--D-alanyl-D-alanine ligase
MRDFTIEEVVKATGGKLASGNGELVISEICTDSREAKPGDLFVCLIGENNDAHKFLPQVLEKGCRAVLVSDLKKAEEAIEGFDAGKDTCKACGNGSKEIAVILVDDTTKALQNMAKYYLETLPLKAKIAVTGSVGKTSTRDMMYAVVASKYKAAKNFKNYNNWFGLPLSILAFPPDTEVCVLEMGMDNFGQIETLAELVHPNIALITNIGISHIEFLGSREGILKAKLEVATFFDETSTLIVNADCDLLSPESKILRDDQASKGYRLESVASACQTDKAQFAPAAAEYTISDICDFGDKGIKYTLETLTETIDISLPLPGAHNATNATLAIAAGELLGITPAEAAQALASAQLTEKRLAIKEARGIKIIDDTYNACPASVMSAITTLMKTDADKEGRRIAIIGDMYELGQETENGHRQVGEFAAESGVDILIAVGDLARDYVAGAGGHMPTENVLYFPEKAELIECLPEIVRAGDIIMVKASRGMKMEEIVNALTE